MPNDLTNQKAPAFSVVDQDEVPVTEAVLKGRWTVLYFYPKDDTPGCTTEACEFTAGVEQFAALDAQVLGVSPDTPERHRRFIEKHGLGIRLLSDPDHAMLEAYGAWGEKVRYGKTSVGVLRSTVLVDPEGRVVRHWRNVTAGGHAEAVRAALASAQAE